MTPELTVLALAALLQAIQIGLYSGAATLQLGVEWNAGPRDEKRDLPPLAGRLSRAEKNHFQGLILFTIAVVTVTLSASSTGFTAALAWIYLLARILYIPAYAFGWSPWRSAIWGVGFFATILMILAALF